MKDYAQYGFSGAAGKPYSLFELSQSLARVLNQGTVFTVIRRSSGVQEDGCKKSLVCRQDGCSKDEFPFIMAIILLSCTMEN